MADKVLGKRLAEAIASETKETADQILVRMRPLLEYTKKLFKNIPRSAGTGPGGAAPPPLGILNILIYISISRTFFHVVNQSNRCRIHNSS